LKTNRSVKAEQRALNQRENQTGRRIGN